MSIWLHADNLKDALTEIDFSSPAYPKEWKELPDAPERVYALGDISLLEKRKLAVVGSRKTPLPFLKAGEEISKELSEAFVILTGTADGGDSAAIAGALRGSGRIICLLAGGFSSLPQAQLQILQRVAETGLLLSPHPFDTPIRSFSYEYRNKLLAKAAEGVLVVSAGEKSGALITAKYAKEYAKKIFAFPYPPNSVSGCGCNRLLKEGGYLTENVADILSRFGLEGKKREKEAVLSAEEKKVYEALRERLEAHVNELAALAGVPAFKLRGVLSALEVKGVVVALGGNRYAAV